MAKRDVHLKFGIGNKFVTVEGGAGYAADAKEPMYDTVNVVIRSKSASGGLGPIDQRTFDIPREQILAIGLNFLGLASQMTPRTLWARSGTVGSSHKEPSIYHLVEEDRKELEACTNEELKQRHGDVRGQYENMRRRMHTLQRCQRLLETLPDAQAQQLDMLLTFLEGTGSLPFGVQLVAVSSEEIAALMTDGKTKH